MKKWLLRLLYAALVMVPIGAIADYTATTGTGTTVFAFVCSTTKVCPAQVLINSSNVEIATSSNPVRTDPTGTTTQPVSAASLPLPTGAATSANQSSQITQETATAGALGTTADTVCSTATGTCSLVALQKYNNNALNSAIPAGANVIGYTTPDPCSQAVKTNKPISQTTNTNLITGTSGKKIYVCSVSLIVGGAENVSFVEGTTGGTCGTSTAAVLGGTTAANGPNLAANGGLTLGNGLGTVMSTATNNNDLCLFQSGSDRNAGNLTYVVQ